MIGGIILEVQHSLLVGLSIKWSEVKMKRKLISIILGCMFFIPLNAQTLIEQIESAYCTLDSAAYLDDVISSYLRWVDEAMREEYEMWVEFTAGTFVNPNGDKDYAKNDSMLCAIRKDFQRMSSKFEKAVRSRIPLYVLNLKLINEQTLQVDTCRLAFNLFYFDERCKDGKYIYCENGEYSFDDSRYTTFSRKIGRNAPKVFKRIKRKHPKYLLYCYDLEKENTILYVIDNDIYVYRIAQMKEYRLDDYMNNRNAIMYK